MGDMQDLEEAWRMYTLMEATEWHFLPSFGGLAEQDEVLMNNVFAIASQVAILRGSNA